MDRFAYDNISAVDINSLSKMIVRSVSNDEFLGQKATSASFPLGWIGLCIKNLPTSIPYSMLSIN